MSEVSKIAYRAMYHGTSRKAAKRIMREGFRGDEVWLASNPKFARGYALGDASGKPRKKGVVLSVNALGRPSDSWKRSASKKVGRPASATEAQAPDGVEVVSGRLVRRKR